MSASGFVGPGDVGASLHATSTTWLIDADSGLMVPHFVEVYDIRIYSSTIQYPVGSTLDVMGVGASSWCALVVFGFETVTTTVRVTRTGNKTHARRTLGLLSRSFLSLSVFLALSLANRHLIMCRHRCRHR